MRKIVALLLCLCVLSAMLTGCGASRIEEYNDPEAAVDETDAPEDAADEEDAATTPDAEPPADPGLGYEAYAPDTVAGTINGEDVTWQEYFYWLNYYVQYVQQLAIQNGFTLSGWDAYELSTENTNAQMVLINAQYAVIQYHTMTDKAEELGITLSAENEATLVSVFEQNADAISGDGDGACTEEESAAFETYLEEQYMSRDFFDYLNRVSLLGDNTFTSMYGASGVLMEDEKVLSFAEEMGVVSAKHILLLTCDMTTGEALSDEQIAEKRAAIDDYHAQLAALDGDQEAQTALFDQLMAQHTEDTGYATFPTGYTYVPGVMVSEFEDAVNALEEYEISDVVESSFGYHIIQRMPVDPNAVVMDVTGQTVSLRYAAANNEFTTVLNGWMDEAEVVWNEGFETLDVASIFGALS